MDFPELLTLAKTKATEERRLSRLATAGEVSAAILTDKGNVYTGVCLDAPAGMGFCAETAAIAAMVAAGESRIVKLVAHGFGEDGACTPCGRCRALIDAIDDGNYKCEVLLEDGSVTTIEQLLPYRM